MPSFSGHSLKICNLFLTTSETQNPTTKKVYTSVCEAVTQSKCQHQSTAYIATLHMIFSGTEDKKQNKKQFLLQKKSFLLN